LALFYSFRGFSPFSVFPVAGSHYSEESQLIRFGCVLRVSHPLDALLPPRPTGLIPSQSRSWGLPFEVLIPCYSRRFFQTPPPSWSSPGPRSLRSFKVSYRSRIRTKQWVLAKHFAKYLRGLHPLGLLIFYGLVVKQDPLSCFFDPIVWIDDQRHPRVCRHKKRSQSFSRLAWPLWDFPPRLTISNLWSPNQCGPMI
jgi:hypothetical protein